MCPLRAKEQIKSCDLAGIALRLHIGFNRKGYPMTLLSVPDMSYGHCEASVKSALSNVAGAAPVTVNLAARQVSAQGPAPALITALAEIGFAAQVLPAK
jgi:copper chaperone